MIEYLDENTRLKKAAERWFGISKKQGVWFYEI